MNYYFEPVNLKKWNMFREVKNIGHIEPMLATKDMKINDIVPNYSAATSFSA